MPKPSSASAPPSVYASNAGHDFHVLWATRRIIELLNPASSLRAVKMEGVAVEDTAKLPNAGDRFLAADLTEYYGGAHFAEADRTVIAQLKYSTRKPNEAWTGAKLRKQKGEHNSVIERLQAAYLDLLAAGHPRVEVQRKVSIRLISNQPLHDKLRGLWQAVQATLRTLGPAPVTYAKLLQHLPAKHHAELDKLYALCGATSPRGPKSKLFTDFWRVLDLNGCAAGDRMSQQLEMLQELAASVPHGGRDVSLKLTELVRQQALPGQENAPPLTQASVLAALGVVDELELFPEPAELHLPAHPVATPEAVTLARALLAPTQRLLAHGDAGVGKTTTVQQLHEHLPAGSVVLVYDCYGESQYRYSSGRHTLQRAFLQLSNELALATGLPFLVVPPTDNYRLRDYFQRHLLAAAKVVDAAGGLLVLVADAADNAVFKAGQEPGADCFVPYLWELTLPANGRLLMTARTHRKASLRVPAGTQELGLTGFDLAASTQRLHQVFPAADAAQAAKFHQRTGGNPRVQAYCLDPKPHAPGSVEALEHTLARPATSAALIIDDILTTAIVQVAEPERAKAQLAILACLHPPIPLAAFARAGGVSPAEATTFCHSLQPGLLLQHDFISFRDEDFDTQLRDRCNEQEPLQAVHKRLGDHFRPLATTQAYAAQAVAEQYAAAHRHRELIDLALASLPLTFIADGAERVRIERRRLELAIGAAAALGDDIAGAKLLVLAAERLQVKNTLKSLVTADPRLAAHFGSAGTVIDHFRSGTDDAWLGTVHYQLAAYYASCPGQQQMAMRHLAQGEAWVERYFSLPDDERQRWRFEAEDITCEAEAYYWLHGPDAARYMLQRWTPVEVCTEALHLLVQRLIKRVPLPELEAQLRALPLLAQCTAQAALWEAGHLVSGEWSTETAAGLLPLLRAQKIAPSLFHWPTSREASSFRRWPLHLAELFTRQGLEAETARLLLGLLPAFPFRNANPHSDYEEIVVPIRVACLQAHLQGQRLTSQELFPPLDKSEYHQSGRRFDEDEAYRRSLGPFIMLYEFWAQWLSQAVVPAAVEQAVRQHLAALRAPGKTADAGVRGRQAQWLRSASSLLVRVTGTEALLRELVDQAQRLTGRAPARGLRRHAAREIFRCWPSPGLAFRYLEQVADDAEADTLSVHSRWSVLLTCAAICFPHDEALSRDFYTRALNAAYQGVGNDVAHRLAVAAEAAARSGTAIPPAEGPAVAAQLAGLVEAYRPYLADEEARMPLPAVLTAATALNPAAGVALALRWDALDIVRLAEGIVPVVHAATRARCWHPAQALGLLSLRGELLDVSRNALDLLSELPSASGEERRQLHPLLSAVARWVARDTPLAVRPAALRRVWQWASERQQAHLPAIEAVRQTIDFIDALPRAADNGANRAPSPHEARQQEKLQQWLTAARQGDIAAFTEWLTTLDSSQEALVPALLELGRQVLPAGRVEVLDLLLRVRSYWERRGYGVLNALEELLGAWRGDSRVQQWATTGLPNFYGAHLSRLTGDEDQPAHLEQFCRLPLANPSRAALLLPGVAKQLDTLSPDELCWVATALTQPSSAPDVLAFVHWLLDRVQAQLHAEGKALPFGELLPNPDAAALAPAAVYAQLIWAVCGNPDKRVRWQAVHAAQQLLGLPENEAFGQQFLAEFLKLTRTTTSWLPPGEEFYWQGARVWALVLLDRLADEASAALLPHLEPVRQHLFAADFPHAQIRELARRILLKVHAQLPTAFSAADLEAVQASNRPKSSLLERGLHVQGPEAFVGVGRSNQFNFNELDTVDHWFDSLAETFGQTSDKITALVEQWMHGRWLRTAAECEADRLHDQDRYESGLLSHYKMDDTTVDNLEMHLTHHALMCVAGELVDRYPIRMDDYDKPTSTWEAWLERYLPHHGSAGWLADWRGPTPLRPECWDRLPRPWRAKPLRHYSEALGAGEPNRAGWLVLHGRHRFTEEEHAGTVSVSSVAVAAEGAPSLLGALQAARRHDYAFPTFGLSDREPEQADDLPALFALTPLLDEEASGDERGLEQHDLAARGVYNSYPSLSRPFMAHCGLRAVKNGQQYLDSEARLAVEYEVWDDYPLAGRGRRSDEEHSAGHRIWVRQDLLQDFLAATGQLLLVHATLSRNVSPREYSQTQRINDAGTRRLALFHPNGRFETVAGPGTPCPPDKAGAGQ